MYKRVAKHARRRAEEDELALDDDDKDVLGLQDTDDSESESSSDDSDDGDESAGSADDAQEGASQKLKRKLGVLYAVSDNDGTQEDESEDEDEDGMSAEDALSNPIFELPAPAGAQSCAMCPGKTMKNLAMAQDHVASAAHLRRRKRFVDASRALKEKGIELPTLSAASVVLAMDAKSDFSQPPRPDSAKARRKHKRDRGGKKRREAREQERASGAAAPLSPAQKQAQSSSAKATKPTARPATVHAAPNTRKSEAAPTSAKTTARSEVPARPPAKRIRREKVVKTKVRVLDA